jgi:predicted dehydrogenase
MGHGIHAMDFFLWLYGDWAEVRAMMGTLDRDIEVEDVSMALVRFKNGAMGSIVNSVLSPREESYLRLDFQKVTVELTHLYRYTNENWRYTTASKADYEDQVARWVTIPEDKLSWHGEQLTSLLDCMARNERPTTSGLGARTTIEFIASLYKSAMSGEPVMRDSIGPDDPYYYRMCGPCPQEKQAA